ncbi:MAG: hypothetical protein RMK64_01875 [Rhodovarius sp.]|nr:hypothetical protein [Rhodovarius sp.]MCX7933541.1 hypothetical protein [Rhodovarius sp.]MDW8313693.1 hypothetical protein [Rhodovarius sp.]
MRRGLGVLLLLSGCALLVAVLGALASGEVAPGRIAPAAAGLASGLAALSLVLGLGLLMPRH